MTSKESLLSDLGIQTTKFVKSRKTDEEEDDEIDRQGGPIDNRPLYERLEEQKKKVYSHIIHSNPLLFLFTETR